MVEVEDRRKQDHPSPTHQAEQALELQLNHGKHSSHSHSQPHHPPKNQFLIRLPRRNRRTQSRILLNPLRQRRNLPNNQIRHHPSKNNTPMSIQMRIIFSRRRILGITVIGIQFRRLGFPNGLDVFLRGAVEVDDGGFGVCRCLFGFGGFVVEGGGYGAGAAEGAAG